MSKSTSFWPCRPQTVRPGSVYQTVCQGIQRGDPKQQNEAYLTCGNLTGEIRFGNGDATSFAAKQA